MDDIDDFFMDLHMSKADADAIAKVASTCYLSED